MKEDEDQVLAGIETAAHARVMLRILSAWIVFVAAFCLLTYTLEDVSASTLMENLREGAILFLKGG
tara:strand:+ start:3882 stop:4079 length:198 start_codon:yes stop_codon:yes gene_type:complete